MVRWNVSVRGLVMVALIGGAMAGGIVTAKAESFIPEKEYAACLKLAQERPSEGFERAGTWQAFGGGTPALHCKATALAGMGKPEAAAALLEETAQSGRDGADVKARLLRQAARSWVDAAQDQRALEVLDAAVKLAPQDVDILEDRAIVRASLDHVWEAVDDLNAVLDAAPRRVSALVLRAAAYRRLETLDMARSDIERALTLDPGNLDALVEKGLLDRAEGKTAEAREAWMKVLRKAPESLAANAARRNLEDMDVKAQ